MILISLPTLYLEAVSNDRGDGMQRYKRVGTLTLAIVLLISIMIQSGFEIGLGVSEVLGSEEVGADLLLACNNLSDKIANKSGNIQDYINEYSLIKERFNTSSEEDKQNEYIKIAINKIEKRISEIAIGEILSIYNETKANTSYTLAELDTAITQIRGLADHTIISDSESINLNSILSDLENMRAKLAETSDKDELRESIKTTDDGINTSDISKIQEFIADGNNVTFKFPSNYTELNVYEGISQQAQDFIYVVQLYEGALNDLTDITQRMNELYIDMYNATSTENDIINIKKELKQLLTEYNRIVDETCYIYGDRNVQYGLTGCSIHFEIPWEQFSTDSILSFSIQNLKQIINQDILDEAEATKQSLTVQIEQISWIRAQLGARQNLANHIVNFADCAAENSRANNIGSGSFNSLGNTVYNFDDINTDMIFTSTLNNAQSLVGFIQLTEGALNTVHSILNRYIELAVKKNYEQTESSFDIKCINEEIDKLNLGISYIMNATGYDGFHFLSQTYNEINCPTGWKELCHNNVKIINGLNLEISNNKTVDEIRDDINGVSYLRSQLGSNQNALDKLINFCEYVLINGPVIGCEFDRDTDGHHTVKNESPAFTELASDIRQRIEELTIQLNNPTYDEIGRVHIQLEIDTLKDYWDIAVDLVQTNISVALGVAKPEENYKQSIIIDRNKQDYKYKITYSSTQSDITNLSIVDYIESGNNTEYAGILTGIQFPDDINTDDIRTFVQLGTVDKTHHTGYEDTTLPDGKWEEIDITKFKQWDSVYAIGVYYGDKVFGPELGEQVQTGFILNMKLDIGKKENSVSITLPSEGYILKNTVEIYERTGDSIDIVKTSSEAYTIVKQFPKNNEFNLSKEIKLGHITNNGIITNTDNKWETNLKGNTNLQINRTGKPQDSLKYHYTLTYELLDGTAEEVCLYDNLENGTNSKYAGRLDSIYFEESEESDMYNVYIQYKGMTADTDVPDLVINTTGQSDWAKVTDVTSMPDNVTAVAVHAVKHFDRGGAYQLV